MLFLLFFLSLRVSFYVLGRNGNVDGDNDGELVFFVSETWTGDVHIIK